MSDKKKQQPKPPPPKKVAPIPGRKRRKPSPVRMPEDDKPPWK